VPTNFPRTDLLTVPSKVIKVNQPLVPGYGGRDDACVAGHLKAAVAMPRIRWVAGATNAGYLNGRRPGDGSNDLSSSDGARADRSPPTYSRWDACPAVSRLWGGLALTDGVRKTSLELRRYFPLPHHLLGNLKPTADAGTTFP
jgi:hypothetical protein